MRFLVDANVSPRRAALLRAEGHDAVAVRDVGLGDAPDDELLDHAAVDDRIVVSRHTDFGVFSRGHLRSRLLPVRTVRNPG